MITRPKSLNERTFVGDLSCRRASCKACITRVPIAPLFHVDQVEHDDAAQVAQPNLPRDLFDRFHVGARDRVFQTRAAAADELAGVDVDRNQRFGLIDDQIAAGLQPDARLDRFIDLSLHAVGFENRFVARVKLDAFDQPRLHAVHELDNRADIPLRNRRESR